MNKTFFSRHGTEQSSRRLDYYDFLPEIVGMNERPPSPLGRLVLWLSLGTLAVGFAWACLGQVDTVVTAEGRVIPNGYVMPAQVPNGGVVRKLYVGEGSQVRKGDVLLEFDTTISQSNLLQSRERLESAKRKLARYRAILAEFGGGRVPGNLDVRDDEIVRQTVRLQQQRLQDLIHQRELQEDELEVVRAEKRRSAELLQLAENLLDSTRDLAGTENVSKLRLSEIGQQAIQKRFDLEVSGKRVTQAERRVARLQSQLAAARSAFMADLLERQAAAQSEIVLDSNELAKAEQESGHARLIAPADGYVTDLKVHASGAVVAAGSQILSLVPRQAELAVEAELANNDVAKVQPNAEVAIKLAAYPFNKFGTVTGRVEGISADAIGSDLAGSNYRLRITIGTQQEVLRSGHIKLLPGMRATAEIKTGRRRFIEYLTTPLVQALQSAGKES